MSQNADRYIGHMNIGPTPWGNAGGVVRTLDEVEFMARAGVGWVEAGSYTLEKRLGNQYEPGGTPRLNEAGELVKVYAHEAGVTYNSLGMPNEGMDEIEKIIPAMNTIARAHDTHVVVNVAPTSNEPVSEVVELVSRAYQAGAEAVLVNLGCPNVLDESGEREPILSHHPELVYKVLKALEPVTTQYRKVFVRVSPMPPFVDQKTYAAIAKSGAVSAVWTPNTFPLKGSDHSPLEVGGGGRSGPAFSNQSRRETREAIRHLRPDQRNIQVVSSSGIMNDWTLMERLALGAVAGAGTTFYSEIRKDEWGEATYKLLRDIERHLGDLALKRTDP